MSKQTELLDHAEKELSGYWNDSCDGDDHTAANCQSAVEDIIEYLRNEAKQKELFLQRRKICAEIDRAQFEKEDPYKVVIPLLLKRDEIESQLFECGGLP